MFKALRSLREAGRSFDMIILDPPKFAPPRPTPPSVPRVPTRTSTCRAFASSIRAASSRPIPARAGWGWNCSRKSLPAPRPDAGVEARILHRRAPRPIIRSVSRCRKANTSGARLPAWLRGGGLPSMRTNPSTPRRRTAEAPRRVFALAAAPLDLVRARAVAHRRAGRHACRRLAGPHRAQPVARRAPSPALSDRLARSMAASLSREAGLFAVHEMMEALAQL